MKKMLLAAAFAALTVSAQAQTDQREMRQNKTPQERADLQARHMQKRLALTDEQTAKIREINVQMMPAKALEGDSKAIRSQRVEMMRKREAAYNQVLTPDQMTQFRKLKEERIEHMQEKRRERMNESTPAGRTN